MDGSQRGNGTSLPGHRVPQEALINGEMQEMWVQSLGQEDPLTQGFPRAAAPVWGFTRPYTTGKTVALTSYNFV